MRLLNFSQVEILIVSSKSGDIIMKIKGEEETIGQI